MSSSFISADDLRDYLKNSEPAFNAKVGLYQRPGADNGYHTRLTSKDTTHPTCINFDYALALLMTGEKSDRERAIGILRTLLTLQDTVPTHLTYGIWPWYQDEPLEMMNPPDWNWADFCGLRVAQVLRHHTDALPEDLTRDLRAALGHAAYSIFRRNIQTAYTNIAIMGSFVALAAAELLSDARIGEYGRRRLQDVIDALVACDGFAEYNSPNYTIEIVNICERALHLVGKPEHTNPIKELHARVWGLIADFFHPGTAQWGGPQSRSYQTWLEPGQVLFFTRRLGFALPQRPGVKSRPGSLLGGPSLYPELPCPSALTERFRELPEKVVEQEKRFLPPTMPRPPLIGKSWMTPTAALGSANRALMWVQTRSVLGYLKTDEDPALQFRLRFLHDGRDFSSAFNFNDQKGPHVLSVMSLILDGGSFHPTLNRPPDSSFEAKDFRMRFELLGCGVTAVKTKGFELRGGKYRVAILPGVSVFDGKAVTWEITKLEDGWAVNAICHAGEARVFPFKEIGRTLLCAGISVLEGDEAAPEVEPMLDGEKDGEAAITWVRMGEKLQVKAWNRPRAENP